MTLQGRLKGVRSVCYRICAASKYARWGGKKRRKQKGKAAAGEPGRRGRRRDRRGEIRRTGCASQSEARSGAAEDRAAEPGARRSAEPSLGLSEDGSSCAVSTGEVPSLLLIN